MAGSNDNFSEAVDLVKQYAKQETLDPLKRIGRYLAFGIAGSLFVAVGVLLLAIGGMRALQTETDAFEKNWNWVPYGLTFVALTLVIGLVASRITGKRDLDG